MPRKAFTVQEADALLPRMREVLGEVRELRAEVEERSGKLHVLDALWGADVRRPGNPDHGEYLEHRAAVRRAVEAIEGRIEEEILARGIRFPPGGLEHGLLDFPTTWQGRTVYLCWRLGEPRVLEWHEVSAGFAGRRPITPEQARGMGRDG